MIKIPCIHNGRFKIIGNNKVGFGTCEMCQEEIDIEVLFNNLASRLLNLEEQLERTLSNSGDDEK